MKDFTVACMTKNSPFKKRIIVFHNAAGFDAHLWYKELIVAKSPPKSIIRKGQKIISMELAQNGIKCRDSLQFLPGTPLSAFPKMFGLETGPKGDFPHGLNTPEWIQWGKNIIYREMVDGEEHRFPLLKYFWPEKLHQDRLCLLKRWHQEMVIKFDQDPSLEYCPEKELVKYCRQDVRVLREGFETYRKTWTKQYPGLEPLDSLTFPAYNNKILRDVYMPKDSLCLLPPLGYDDKNRQYSVTSMAWIAWMERRLGLRNVRTARKGFEVKISGYNMDGTGVDSNGDLQILQFHGCYWHGHDCIEKRSEILDTRHERTIAMDEHMEQLSGNPLSPYGKFTYHRIYECEFWAQVGDNPTMSAFVEDYMSKFSREPLRLREALRGGRTNAIKHHIVPVPDGWILYYDDYTSLYPAVNFGINGEVWPIGHPEIYIGKDLELAPPEAKDWFGFASVVLLPPKDLLHPVLGQSIGGKLLFHLCTTCAENLQQGPCSHSDKEREIKGTFFTGEISLAISKGYKLIWTQELWHWPPEQRSPDLFRGLILDQYAKKALSSPVPKDPEEFRRLLDEYKDTMGLDLKEEDFKENKAMRALAKFSLNNIWGFLGKRNDMEETEFVNSFARFLELQNDESLEITRTEITDDEESVLVTFKPLHEEASRNGNIALAAMTTAYARMALYKVIDQYPEQVVYMDTDSLFLLLPPGVQPPPTSTVLGGLKDEIYEEFGAGAKITQFASIGPKSYTYSVAKDGQVLKEVVKMKGISFNSEASSVVTPAAMRNLQPGGEKLQAPQHVIRKDIFKTRMWNAEMVKQVRFQSRKRWFKPAPNALLDTLPYGFV